MPAADILTYVPQLVWLFTLFFLFHLVMRLYIYPSIASIFFVRKFVLKGYDLLIKEFKK